MSNHVPTNDPATPVIEKQSGAVAVGEADRLGTNRERLPPTQLDDRRTWRHRARRWSAKLAEAGKIDRRGAAICYTAADEYVTVAVHDIGNSRVRNVKRCGSPWACACCSPTIGEQRATEADEAIRANLDRGGSAVFVTVTMPHGASMPLDLTLGAVQTAWSKTWSGRSAKTFKQDTAMIGSLRVVEITHSETNGWHPHIHAVLLFDGQVKSEVVKEWIGPRWRKHVKAQGFRTPSKQHGIDCRKVTTGSKSLGNYLTKVEGAAAESWTAGRELVRTDLKKAHWKGSSTWEILSRAVAGEERATELWTEYEAATKGRRRVVTSPGLRDQLDLDKEQTDEEAAVETTEAEAIQLVLVPAIIWQRWDQQGLTGVLIATIELEVLTGALIGGVFHERPTSPN